jgi:hypothetical protein
MPFAVVCAVCDIRSVCEPSGRTNSRLRSTGLPAMPSEGRHSRHSVCCQPLLPPPGSPSDVGSPEPDWGAAFMQRAARREDEVLGEPWQVGPAADLRIRRIRIRSIRDRDASPEISTLSDDYGPAASCRRMDLAAAPGARATRMSLLWAGWSSWRTRACESDP